jgi:tetratricopeptide (TPR) repeat protein
MNTCKLNYEVRLMKFRIILTTILVVLLMILPALAAEASEPVQTAGALYSQSVDLANGGKYKEALDASDQALAMNVTSLTGLIQSNRAGILVMLKRNQEAITAADAAIAVEGNLTSVHSIAWFNKGNALRALGRTAEAKDAYAKAYALDNTLVPPADMGVVNPLATTLLPATTQRSPLPVFVIVAALGAVCLLCTRSGKPRE